MAITLSDRYRIATGNQDFNTRMQMALVQKAKSVHDDLEAWIAANAAALSATPPTATIPQDKIDADSLAAKVVKDLAHYASLFCISIAALLPDPGAGADLSQYPDDVTLLAALDQYWPYAAIAAKMT